jgi:phytoene dehydrogenase-like protein
MSAYHAIIIGASHDGLILQAYLGKAGLKTICIEGDLLVGASTSNQIGFNRPFPGAGSYWTHLPRPYLCGSSSHLGGNVTGFAGLQRRASHSWRSRREGRMVPRRDRKATAQTGDLTIAERCQRT